MTKGIIYYTNNKISNPIRDIVREKISNANLPIISSSLIPMRFGVVNVVVEGESGYVTMIKQIISALEHYFFDYVFFCEHDVLYHPSHFKFDPPREDIYYYNENGWRWYYGSKTAIRYDRMISLSGLCVNRELVLNHYLLKWENIKKMGLEKFKGREPQLARKWGYEPGTKKKKRGGLTDEDFETWSSELPNVDIRHKGTFSPPKTTLESFKHPPVNWKEIPVKDIPGWNIEELFNI